MSKECCPSAQHCLRAGGAPLSPEVSLWLVSLQGSTSATLGCGSQGWCVLPQAVLPSEPPLPLSPQPSELESDSEEYQTHNDTDLELEEQGGVTVLELSAVQVSVPAPFLGTAPVLPCRDSPQWQPGLALL